MPTRLYGGINLRYPVIKGTAYCLFHAPDLLLTMGTTQRIEKLKTPRDEYLEKVAASLRSYDEVVSYAPNQAFIGNLWPDELEGLSKPWYNNLLPGALPRGKFGDIVTEDLLMGLVKFADSFDLVCLEAGFQKEIKGKLRNHDLFQKEDFNKWKDGNNREEILKYINEDQGEPLYLNNRLIGCVRRAHDIDENLNAHVMLENLVSKATGIWVTRRLLQNTSVDPGQIEYIIEASEEACGDMNQRGGGNFAKAIGELCGLTNATGADIRSFCAGPAHAMVMAASLIQAGIYKNVIVVGGGCVAKLGMNSRDHIKKGIPILEDVIGSFAILLGEDDGLNPVVRTDIIGRHKIGSGATPQAVIEALVTEPLTRAGLGITDIDKFAPELQNPEITEPAGAGNVPKANYKMIGALAVMKGVIQRTELEEFTQKHGIPGYAPTQGHIPSGVPFVGFAREGILAGKYQRVMIIGKGSLFLGRMTGLFDGISLVIEGNKQETADKQEDAVEVRSVIAAVLRQVARELLS